MHLPLELIVSVLAVTTEDAVHYVDTKTGEIVSIMDPFDADDPSDLLEAAVQDDRYVPLPAFEEIEAEGIRARFADAQADNVREDLLRAARGLYAAFEFPAAVRDAGLQREWEAFNDEALALLAARWGEKNCVVLDERASQPQLHEAKDEQAAQ